MELHKTADGNHGVNIVRNGGDGDYMAFAVQSDGNGGFEYWYTIGSSYKTIDTALRYAGRSLAKHGYLIAD